jgi:hypothetical protein
MKNFPNRTRIGRTIADVPLTSGYRFELPLDHEITAIPAAVKAWFPEISVGSARGKLKLVNENAGINAPCYCPPASCNNS